MHPPSLIAVLYATVRVALAGTFTFDLGTPNSYIFRLFDERYAAATAIPEPSCINLLAAGFVTLAAAAGARGARKKR